MRYKILFILLIALGYSQSVYNRFLGASNVSGPAISSSMGNTHLLNAIGSQGVRYNPAKLSEDKGVNLNLQMARNSISERWGMPVRDSFGEFLTHADYVSNENAISIVTGGVSANILGIMGVGFHYSPLTHFNYSYSEEVRGSYRTADGEYASKDPLVGFHNLNIEGMASISSFGVSTGLSLFDIHFDIGASGSMIQPFTLYETVDVDTLYSEVTNLSEIKDLQRESRIWDESAQFFNLSWMLSLSERLKIGTSFETGVTLISDNSYVNIDSTNGLFEYWDDNNNLNIYGLQYEKPQCLALSLQYKSSHIQPLTLTFELNQLKYNKLEWMDDYKRWKFGFEYLTQLNTPIRGGIEYKSSRNNQLNSSTIFTFGSGKSLSKLDINVAGTYTLLKMNYVDLFPVINDVRPSTYDAITESNFNLICSIHYKF
jgi:hypothetical protein